MIDDHRDQKVKVTVRFFNIDDGVIHTTDKIEIEIDDEVIIYVTVLGHWPLSCQVAWQQSSSPIRLG